MRFIASGPRGDVALGIGLRFCDAHGFWSSDGNTWRKMSQPPDAGRKLTGCAYMNGVTATDHGFVAVGSRPTGSAKKGGVVWTSSDGDQWHIADTGSTFLTRGPSSVASDGRLIVAAVGPGTIGATSGAELWYSADGARWAKVSLGGEHVYVSAVAHGPHGWVAVGTQFDAGQIANGALVWRSNNGRHWTRVDGVAGRELRSVDAGPAGFLAFGFAERKAVALTSIDGRAWATTPAPSSDTNSGVVVGKLFVCLGVAGYLYEPTPERPSHPQPALWVLDRGSWVRAFLPKVVFSEPLTHGQRVSSGQPMFGPGVVTPDGSLLVVGGGQPPKVTLQRTSYGPRVSRWRPPGSGAGATTALSATQAVSACACDRKS